MDADLLKNNNNCSEVNASLQEFQERTIIPQVKITQVTKLQDQSEVVLSSGGEDEDAKDFLEILKEDPTWTPPSVELETKMRQLLEHYFSDENLVKDKFLLKHVKRNRMGYVSVKLLTSFKKLKNLSRSDWRITAYSILKSTTLELNKPGTKVRRKETLPDIDLPTTSIRTLLYKLPEDTVVPNMDVVYEQFQEFGKLTSVRIIHPGKEVPSDLRNHTSKHPEIGVLTCIVIEYDDTGSAQNAFKTLCKKAREENKADMYCLLGSGRNPKKHSASRAARNKDGLGYDSSEDSASPSISSRENSPLMHRKFINGRSGLKGIRSTSPLASPQGSRDTSPDRSFESRSPKHSPKPSRKNKSGSLSNSPSGSPWFPRKGTKDSPTDNSWGYLPKAKHGMHQKTSPLATNSSMLSPGDSVSGSSTPVGGTSPWLQRRRQFVNSQGASPASTPGSSPLLGKKFQDGVPIGVSRLPKGPPNSSAKGFQTAKRKLHADVLLDELKQDVKELAIVN